MSGNSVIVVKIGVSTINFGFCGRYLTSRNGKNNAGATYCDIVPHPGFFQHLRKLLLTVLQRTSSQYHIFFRSLSDGQSFHYRVMVSQHAKGQDS